MLSISANRTDRRAFRFYDVPAARSRAAVGAGGGQIALRLIFHSSCSRNPVSDFDESGEGDVLGDDGKIKKQIAIRINGLKITGQGKSFSKSVVTLICGVRCSSRFVEIHEKRGRDEEWVNRILGRS